MKKNKGFYHRGVNTSEKKIGFYHRGVSTIEKKHRFISQNNKNQWKKIGLYWSTHKINQTKKSKTVNK